MKKLLLWKRGKTSHFFVSTKFFFSHLRVSKLLSEKFRLPRTARFCTFPTIRILLIGLLFLGCFSSWYDVFAACSFWWDVKWSLQSCFTSGTKVVTASDMSVTWGLKTKILWWVNTIAGLLWLLAVGAIVYGGMLFVLSGWIDEKVTKWKKIIKWAILGLIGLVSASSLIALVVNIMFAV